MGRRKKGKEKLPLILSTCVALLAVFTASVSTFAWFQAEANVQISTTSTGTTIMVNKPDPVAIDPVAVYAYRGNGTHGYSSATISEAFATEFPDEVTGSSISISGLWPGYKMTFAIKIHTSSTLTYGKLSLVSYSATRINNRITLNATKTEIAGTIAIEEAINIYAGCNSTGTYVVNEDAFNYTGSTLSDLELIKSGVGNVINGEYAYFFYTIELSNANPTLYQEYSVIFDESEPPEISEVSELYDTPKNDSEPRYFAKKTTLVDSNTVYLGSSSCYEGLDFTIASLKVEVY